MGEYHKKLEQELVEYLDTDYVSLFNNGHMALEILIQSMKLKGEVITTPFTFASTTHAIVRNGLEPIFCDIKKDDYTIDEKKIEELITDKTVAILPVHVYGNVCNVDEIQKIARKYNLRLIYDGAHAFGQKYKGNSIAKFGDATMFSFHATKVFNTIEGGAISYRDGNLGEKLYELKNFGIKSQEIVEEVGLNAKMNEIQAIMGLCNLENIDDEIDKRKHIDLEYRKYLEEVNGINIKKINKDIKSNYSYFPIVINEKEFGATRDEIYELLKNNNIFARKYFYPLTSEYECYRQKYNSNDTPNALYISKRILTLPIYSGLDDSDIERICKLILSMKK